MAGHARSQSRQGREQRRKEGHRGQGDGQSGGKPAPKPWWMCADCGWKNQPTNVFCGKCSVIKTKRSTDLPERRGCNTGSNTGKGGGKSGSKGGGNGGGRSSSASNQGRTKSYVEAAAGTKEKELQAQNEALHKQLKELQQRAGQPASLPAGDDATMEPSSQDGGTPSQPVDLAQQIKDAQACITYWEQIPEGCKKVMGSIGHNVRLEELQEKLAALREQSRQAKPIAQRLRDIKQRVTKCDHKVDSVTKQIEAARKEKLAIDAKCADLDQKLEEAKAAAVKAKEEQMHIYKEVAAEGEKPAGPSGDAGGGTHDHLVQLGDPTALALAIQQGIAQAIQLQCPPEEASAVLAVLQRLDLTGVLVPVTPVAPVTPLAAGATPAVVPVVPGATGMAADAERLQLEAAIAGGKSGKGKGNNFQPYEKGSETHMPDGSKGDL